MNKREGFTVVELLVVISIIGLLITLTIITLDNARRKARDAKRLADMKQIQTALELYYDRYNQYPPRTADDCCDGWDQGPCGTEETFIASLATTGIMPKVPTDPKGGTGTGCYGYNYYRYNAGSEGCDTIKGAFYVLGVRDMETANVTYTALDDGTTRIIHESSPGWHCPEDSGATRDWQDEYDWVIGKFEK